MLVWALQTHRKATEERLLEPRPLAEEWLTLVPWGLRPYLECPGEQKIRQLNEVEAGHWRGPAGSLWAEVPTGWAPAVISFYSLKCAGTRARPAVISDLLAHRFLSFPKPYFFELPGPGT